VRDADGWWQWVKLEEPCQREMVHVEDLSCSGPHKEVPDICGITLQIVLRLHQAPQETWWVYKRDEALLCIHQLNCRDDQQRHTKRPHHLIEHFVRGVGVSGHAGEHEATLLKDLHCFHRLCKVSCAAATEGHHKPVWLPGDVLHDRDRL